MDAEPLCSRQTLTRCETPGKFSGPGFSSLDLAVKCFLSGKKKEAISKGPPAMFCLLALHKPPTTISYTGWHEGYTGTLKMTTPRDAAAAGGAAARAADGKKESEMPNAMSACLSPWKASHLATSSCPVNYNNSSYNYTHRIE